jgi:hypothetical protein
MSCAAAPRICCTDVLISSRRAPLRGGEYLYFCDPDGNVLQIYWERPHAREIFTRGRKDQDKPIALRETKSHDDAAPLTIH